MIEMNETDRIYEKLVDEKKDIEQKLRIVDYELGICDKENKSIIIKKVREKLYYYEQWRMDRKVHSKYLAPVKPGIIYKEEEKILHKQELIQRQKELREAGENLEQMLKILRRTQKKQKITEDFLFETYWKDEITARVRVQGGNIFVSKYTDHPVKQLFASEKMTRFQLMQILELRCWDRNREDIQEILQHFGLKEYNPYEIVKKTHGVSYNDYNWFRFPGEKLTSKDVLVR